LPRRRSTPSCEAALDIELDPQQQARLAEAAAVTIERFED
jgi:hypothetical protein